MAAAYSSRAKHPVLLGYPDEDVVGAVDFTTNMIGGTPVSDSFLRHFFVRGNV